MNVSNNEKQRLVTLDAARFLAAVGVIWIHVCQTPLTHDLAGLGRFAVPFFAATAGYLLVASLERKKGQTFANFAGSRLHRLYLPFLVWSFIYFVLKWANKVVLGNEGTVIPGWEFWVLGGAYHLWFIPYLILATIVGFALTRFINSHRSSRYGVAAISYCAGLTLAVGLTFAPTSDNAFSFMAMATPAFAWGLGIGWLKSAKHSKVNSSCTFAASLPFTLIFLALFFASVLIPVEFGRSPLMENASGVALMLLALNTRLPSTPKMFTRPSTNLMSKLGRVSFGIYFSHLIFIEGGCALIKKMGGQGDLTEVVSLFLFATVASIACSLVAYSHKQTRWLVA